MRPFSTYRCSKRGARWLPTLVAASLGLVAVPAFAGRVWLPGVAAGGVTVPAQSLQARRFARTVHQRYDYSCGSAAVATLLTYQYDHPVGELTVFDAMWKRGDQAKIRHEGFSLLDMKHYLDAHGFESNGYITPLHRLEQVGIPAIVLVSERGYNHFVVVKGLGDGRVLVGDPSAGTRTVPLKRFHEMLRSRILFVVTNHRKQAIFNGRADWSDAPLAPLGMATSPTTLSLTRVLSPGTIQF